MKTAFIILIFSCLQISALDDANASENQGSDEKDKLPSKTVAQIRGANPILTPSYELTTVNPGKNAQRQAYFGDLHVHTAFSFDAFAFGTLARPDDAYRFARGESIKHPYGFDMQLREPLDFYAVTDHAMFLGLVPVAADTATRVSKLEIFKDLHNLNAPDNLTADSVKKRLALFRDFTKNVPAAILEGNIDQPMLANVTRSAWLEIIDAAEKYNDPGKFTTFIGFEYTSWNIHRNVIFKGADHIPSEPFSRYHSANPEDLWDWMDGLREQGIESLAIPHNSNWSLGAMFQMTDWAGDAIDMDYANQRMRNEPLVEITQIKGTSDTHPALSTTDEWSDFEIAYLRDNPTPEELDGSYVRRALQHGVSMDTQGQGNPYKFGFIGSSDTHVAATSDDESNFYGKLGLIDGSSQQRHSAAGEAYTLEKRDLFATELYSASGLAGVWAEENTRAAIYDAFRRKETFATSGPRIKVRFFAGYDFDETMLDSGKLAEQAYAKGVPMGGDLLSRQDHKSVPKFLVWAMRDPRSAPLQRLQVIKGWVDDQGNMQEKVYDVACSDGLQVDPSTQRCPDNGALVFSDCSVSDDVGDNQLKALWTDPEFDPGQKAFYYVRGLENPTCRWSTWDAFKAGVKPRLDLPKTIQERVWSSPIWYVP